MAKLDKICNNRAVSNAKALKYQLHVSKYHANADAHNTPDAANGNVRLSLDAANTANIKAGRYLYDIKRTDANNAVTRLVEGIITVTPQVSQ